MADDDEPPPEAFAAAEAAFLAAERGGGEGAPVLPQSPVEDDNGGGQGGELPDLGSLMERVPAGVRGLFDELYRARFEKVRRIKAKHFFAPGESGGEGRDL